MKKIIIALLVATGLFTSCKKAEELRYESHDNIYFSYFKGTENGVIYNEDSIIYSFTSNPGRGKDTVWVPVRISGIRENVNRKFVVRALPDSSTALADKHYKPFEAFYTMPAGFGGTRVPLIIYNTDTLLRKKSVSLKFMMYATDDLGVLFPKLIKWKVVFSNKLEYPGVWWSMWMGGYSQIKHQFFIMVTGLTVLSDQGLDAPKNQYIAGLVFVFMRDPFKWISKNPTQGYVIEKHTNDDNYDFYSKDNPGVKIQYKKSAQDGLYYFIDENGNEIH